MESQGTAAGQDGAFSTEPAPGGRRRLQAREGLEESGLPDLLLQIGRTPLLRLRRVVGELPPGVEVHAKAEHLNPGGSVKDRPARAMILAGERSGRLAPGRTLLDATSGNTGIAYAMIGAARGHRVLLCMPKNVSEERRRILRAFGAEIVETSPLEGTDGAQRRAKELAQAEPGRYFYPDQYNNEENWRAHYETTAREIWSQTQGRVSHFVAGLGTSGTFVGVVRGLREGRRSLRAVSVQPDSPLHGIEGLKHMGSALVPGIYDPGLADENLAVATEEAQEMACRLAREEGLFVGVSAGANVVAALRVARAARPGSLVVTILCDAGGRYLSESFWTEGER